MKLIKYEKSVRMFPPTYLNTEAKFSMNWTF